MYMVLEYKKRRRYIEEEYIIVTSRNLVLGRVDQYVRHSLIV